MQAGGKSASHGTANNTSQSDSLEMLILVFKYLHVHFAYMLHCSVQTNEDAKNLEIAKSNEGGGPETVQLGAALIYYYYSNRQLDGHFDMQMILPCTLQYINRVIVTNTYSK